MIRVGDDGGIAVGVETTWNTAAATPVWQHGIGTTIGLRRALVKSNRLQRTRQAQEYAVGYVEGGITVEYDQSPAVISPLLNLFGVASAGQVLCTGLAPTNASGTVWVNHGGVMYRRTGCVGSTLRFELANDKPVTVTADFVGGGETKPTVISPTLPADSGIFFPSDIGAILVGGAAVVIKGASFEIGYDVRGSDRQGLGASAIVQPVQCGFHCTGSLQCELADDTGNDTEAVYDQFIAGTALGDISLSGGDFVLASCYMTGDTPSLQPCAQEFAINFDAASLLLDNLA